MKYGGEGLSVSEVGVCRVGWGVGKEEVEEDDD